MKTMRTKPLGETTTKGLSIASFCVWDGETLVLNILGRPSANKDAVGKVKGKQLKVSVTATPVAGRATDHMVRFLAGEFGVTPKEIKVVFGRFSVNKQIRINSPQKLPAVVAAELEKSRENQPGDSPQGGRIQPSLWG